MALATGSGYVWLTPATPAKLPRPAQLLLQPPTVRRLQEMLAWLVPEGAPSEPVHLDFETTGLATYDPTVRVVGVGLATSKGVAYLDAREAPDDWWAELVDVLDRRGVVAFNANFDYGLLYRHAGRHLNLVGCSYTAFRLACNEGHFGQRWGLEVAQREVLRWPVTNKSTLNDLLGRHGIKSKGDMWRLAELEPEAFGRYCAEDADASYQLWNHVLTQGDAGQTTLRRFCTQEWATSIKLLVETRHRGVSLDVPKLRTVFANLEQEIAAAEAALRVHPRLVPHITEREAERAAVFFAPHVTVSRVKCSRAEVEERCQKGDHPEDWFFEHSEAKSLAAWQKARGGYWYREVLKERPRNEGRAPPQFNFESDPDLRWLLYEKVYRAEVREVENAWGRTEKRTTVFIEDGRTVEVGTTDSGLPPVSREILPALGEIGRLLGEFNRLTKLKGYVQAYLDGAVDGVLHLGFKPASTLSGRLAGG